MLTLAFPSFRQLRRGNPFIWEGKVRPIGGSEYKVRITYKYGRRPIVEVLDPPLVGRGDGAPVPHTFDERTICLHVIDEWDAAYFIHETIVPWTCLWLYFYEMWLATGEWLGGGHGSAQAPTTKVSATETP